MNYFKGTILQKDVIEIGNAIQHLHYEIKQMGLRVVSHVINLHGDTVFGLFDYDLTDYGIIWDVDENNRVYCKDHKQLISEKIDSLTEFIREKGFNKYKSEIVICNGAYESLSIVTVPVPD